MAASTLLLLVRIAQATDLLPVLPTINSADLTVSGISSGGFMAVQLHVAFSSRFRGTGIIAAGPFFCAQGLANVALTSCLTTPALISVAELAQITRNTRLTLTIDDPSNMKDHRVWLYSGKKDSVVNSGVVKKLRDYYGIFVSTGGNVKTEYDVPAEHAWPTDAFGNECAYKGEPFINNCGFDAAGALLQHLYESKLTPPSAPASLAPRLGRLIAFDQRPFLPKLVDISMMNTGYIYIPPGCDASASTGSCGLHVALHGCEQSTSDIDTQFVEKTGLNAWADANSLVILYPQATPNVIPFNPAGCWDWWGYTGEDYASKLGVQMAAVMRMVDHVLGRGSGNATLV